MLQAPPPQAILEAWERGLEQSPVRFGLTLLGLFEPDVEPNALAAINVGERNRRLLMLRESLFGEAMIGVTACPSCSEQLEIEFTTRELLAIGPRSQDVSVLLEDGWHVRLPDSRDLLAMEDADAVDAPALLLKRCIVNGDVTDAKTLPAATIAQAIAHLEEADPHADLQFALTCPACERRWSAPIDVIAYLRAEIAAWAGRMLAAVHDLATAYGWTENEVLALSPARRQSYLRMVGA